MIIRKLKPQETKILEDMLYDAVFQPEQEPKLPREVIYQPDLYHYIEDFGKKDDRCLVAEADGEIVGAVWTRILAEPNPGYGNVDPDTPEFAISINENFRGRGIGTKLMEAMIQLLREDGYAQASLSVAKDNYALSMYRKTGFQIIEEKDEDYLMLLKL